MTTRYTNAEWSTFIADIERDLDQQSPSHSHRNYPIPELGSPAFASTIDHTLLKLDAKAVQIDALCAEARVEGFAVSMPSNSVGQIRERRANPEIQSQIVRLRPSFLR